MPDDKLPPPNTPESQTVAHDPGMPQAARPPAAETRDGEDHDTTTSSTSDERPPKQAS